MVCTGGRPEEVARSMVCTHAQAYGLGKRGVGGSKLKAAGLKIVKKGKLHVTAFLDPRHGCMHSLFFCLNKPIKNSS